MKYAPFIAGASLMLLAQPAFSQHQAGMVPLGETLRCRLEGLTQMFEMGKPKPGSVDKLICAISGRPEKDIPLQDHAVKDQKIRTRDFGDVSFGIPNLNVPAVAMQMRPSDQDRLAAFLSR